MGIEETLGNAIEHPEHNKIVLENINGILADMRGRGISDAVTGYELMTKGLELFTGQTPERCREGVVQVLHTLGVRRSVKGPTRGSA